MLGGKNGIHTWMVDLSIGLVFHLKCELIYPKVFSPRKNPTAPLGAPVFGSHGWCWLGKEKTQRLWRAIYQIWRLSIPVSWIAGGA